MDRLGGIVSGQVMAERGGNLVPSGEDFAIRTEHVVTASGSHGRGALYAPDGTRTGRLTSGGYSVPFGQSIGMGYVRPEHATVGAQLRIRMQNALWPARIVEDSPYDPDNARIRADG